MVGKGGWERRQPRNAWGRGVACPVPFRETWSPFRADGKDLTKALCCAVDIDDNQLQGYGVRKGKDRIQKHESIVKASIAVWVLLAQFVEKKLNKIRGIM